MKAARAKPIREPVDEAALLEGEPRLGTKSHRFWQYAKAFCRGVTNATGEPHVLRPVKGHQDVLVQTCAAFAIDEDRGKIKGDELLEWIEQTVQEFATVAPKEWLRFNRGVTYEGFARWLEAGKPGMQAETSGVKVNRR